MIAATDESLHLNNKMTIADRNNNISRSFSIYNFNNKTTVANDNRLKNLKLNQNKNFYYVVN